MFDKRFRVGERYILSADSNDLGLEGYNIQISSPIKILALYDKDVLISIDKIDEDRKNVIVRVNAYKLSTVTQEEIKFYN